MTGVWPFVKVIGQNFSLHGTGVYICKQYGICSILYNELPHMPLTFTALNFCKSTLLISAQY